MNSKSSLFVLSGLLFLLMFTNSYAQEFGIESVEDSKNIFSIRERVKIMNRLLQLKQKTVLPEVMRRGEIDMWIIRNNETAFYLSLLQSEEDGLVKRSPPFLIFFDRGEEAGIEWLSGRFDDLAEIIKERNPKRIGINEESEWKPYNYGFSEFDKAELERRIGKNYASRIVSAKMVSIWWHEARTPEELSVFRHVVGVAHDVIAEAFSNTVVIPDVTTTFDLNWWMRQKYIDLGIDIRSHTTITLQRSPIEREKYDDDDYYFSFLDERYKTDPAPIEGLNTVIRRGDLIFCDTGIMYLGLNTDIQQMAYVLKDGETDAPEGLKEALRHVNRLQDLISVEMKQGRTGSDIGWTAVENAKKEGIRPKVYCHPLSYFFRRYGPIGGFFSGEPFYAGTYIHSERRSEENRRRERPRFDLRVPTTFEVASPEYPLQYNTVYAFEMDIQYEVPEWDYQNVIIFSETTMAFTPHGMVYPDGRQTEYYLIK